MSMPPGQPPGSSPGRPLSKSAASAGRAWPRRHPVWTSLIALTALLVIIIGSLSGSPRTTKTSHSAAVASPTPSPTVKPVVAARLTCDARPTKVRPRDDTTFRMIVMTAAHTRVAVSSKLALTTGERRRGRAGATGIWTVALRVGHATPGVPVVARVNVFRHGSKGHCAAWIEPRRAPRPSPTPSPTVTRSQPPPAPSCYPLSDEGTCYEPGEYCRDSDHGASGVAGDGEKIICEDNDGWRWEPA
jgi:hypothetical protein